MDELDGRAFLARMPAELAGQRGLLGRLVDEVERWDATRWLVIGASVGRGNADAYSDLDVGLGLVDDALPEAFDEVHPLVSRCGDPLDVLVHRMPAFEPRPHRHAFVQYGDGLQLDLTVLPASSRKGHVSGEVVLYDPGDVLAGPFHPESFRIDADRVREWAFLGWWALGDLVKYVRRGSVWEAEQRLGEARQHVFRLHGAAYGVPDATFGLTALLDAPGVGLPSDVERTAPALDADGLRRAALALADLLDDTARRAAEVVPTELPDALSTYIRQRLAAL